MRRSRRFADAGFSLIELMVGIAIGLFATLAVTQILVMSEGSKRATSAGTDATTNGALAINTLQRSLLPAGYGFAAVPGLLGCQLIAFFNGAPVPGFPTSLAPVTITNGVDGAADTIRVFASGKDSFSLPLRVVTPGYVAGNQGFPVNAVRSVEGPQFDGGGAPSAPGDLMVAAVSTAPAVPCEMFQVTANPGVSATVDRADQAAKWNPPNFPAIPYPADALLVNMGRPVDVTYSITNNALAARTLRMAVDGTPSYEGPVELFPHIVQMQALYGKDTNADGTVDIWDNTTPNTAALWQQVLALRLALVARSSQYERDDVTFENVKWDVGSKAPIADTVPCGASKCLEVKVDNLPDWKRYRYRLFDTIVPLRNMLWNN